MKWISIFLLIGSIRENSVCNSSKLITINDSMLFFLIVSFQDDGNAILINNQINSKKFETAVHCGHQNWKQKSNFWKAINSKTVCKITDSPLVRVQLNVLNWSKKINCTCKSRARANTNNNQKKSFYRANSKLTFSQID